MQGFLAGLALVFIALIILAGFVVVMKRRRYRRELNSRSEDNLTRTIL